MRWIVLGAVLVTAAFATASPDPMPPEVSAGSGSGSDDLPALTDDPVLGKSGKIDGRGMHGIVAFTFDDGPNPKTTPAVIDALEKYDIPATFFIVTRHFHGKEADESRAILQREIAAGFLIGSHSASHHNLKHATSIQITSEIDDSFRILAREARRTIGLFRPPYGALSIAGRTHLEKLGVTEVTWSVDPRDWKAKDAVLLRKTVVKEIVEHNGGIVLMHDVKPITAKIIGEVLDDLEAQNCKRLDEKRDPIVPVSIHYFLRDGNVERPIPADVQKRTEAYRLALPVRCANRAARATAAIEEAKQKLLELQEERAKKSSRRIGDFGRPDEKPRRTRHLPPHCVSNPKSCD
jgi:peptidoglycan/xylan/chitin deacetylase (PgdA/CDA1 family)